MRKLLVTSLFTLLPLVGTATTTTPSEETASYSLTDIALISAGAIAGAVLVDFLIGGSLTIPAADTLSPAAIEASAAGAVFGDQIAAATMVKDAKARADIIYALFIGSGAVLGAVALDNIWSWTTTTDSTPYSK